MITGSHNPPEFNGFKISHGLHSLYGDKIQILKGLIDKNDFESGNGSSSATDILDAYMDTISKVIDIPRKLKVVVDGGNGCFGITGPQLLRKLGLNPIEQFCEPDGNFPNHHPDPTVPEYMQDLIDRVRSEKARLGNRFRRRRGPPGSGRRQRQSIVGRSTADPVRTFHPEKTSRNRCGGRSEMFSESLR